VEDEDKEQEKSVTKTFSPEEGLIVSLAENQTAVCWMDDRGVTQPLFVSDYGKSKGFTIKPAFLDEKKGQEPPEAKVAPKTIYDALFSVQFVVANVLVGRPIDLDTFYDRPLDDPEVLAMASRVSCVADADTDFPAHFSGEVQLRLTDGRVLERQVPDSHGTPQDPMSDDEVRAKFRSTAERRVPSEQAARISAIVDKLETLGDIGQLVETCVVPAAG